jgi:hypothetical protein
MEKLLIIDKKTSQFFCRLSTGLALGIRDFKLAERFDSLVDVNNFLLDQEIDQSEVYIIQEVKVIL